MARLCGFRGLRCRIYEVDVELNDNGVGVAYYYGGRVRGV